MRDNQPREDMDEACPEDLPEQTGAPLVITTDTVTGEDTVTEDGRVPKH